MVLYIQVYNLFDYDKNIWTYLKYKRYLDLKKVGLNKDINF